MGNISENAKNGDITIGQFYKLLIAIIGQNVILDFMPKEEQEAYERDLQRIYNNEKTPEHYLAPESPYWYCEQFLKSIMVKYECPPRLMENHFLGFISSIEIILWSYNIMYNEYHGRISKLSEKKDIILYVLHEHIFRYIDNSVFSIIFDLPNSIIRLLTDSYDDIFKELISNFKNEKVFYEAMNDYYEKNHNKYSNLSEKEIINYYQNIINWRSGNACNPYWRTLVPVLDFLKENHITFVHRLIGLYLRKNAQEALSAFFSISKDDLKEIIEKIVTMINEKIRPDKLLGNLTWLHLQRILTTKCLIYQNNYKNYEDKEKSSEIIEYLKHNFFCSPEEKFLYFWLKARARIFEMNIDLKKIKKEIADDYRDIFNKYCKYLSAGFFFKQFLVEAMVINKYARREINIYYEYGYTCEIFCADKQELLNILKEYKNTDLRKVFADINYRHCPIK